MHAPVFDWEWERASRRIDASGLASILLADSSIGNGNGAERSVLASGDLRLGMGKSQEVPDTLSLANRNYALEGSWCVLA